MKFLLFGLLVLQAVATPPTPDAVRTQTECEAQLEKLIQKPTRIVVPFNYTGDICYQTFGDSLVCETPKDWKPRQVVKPQVK